MGSHTKIANQTDIQILKLKFKEQRKYQHANLCQDPYWENHHS